MSNIRLSSIYTYPIKSLKGIELQQAFAEERGFQYDRRWMLIDPQGNMITQRNCPIMATITVSVLDGGLKVTAPGMEALNIPFTFEHQNKTNVTVWQDNCEAHFVGDFADDWFSKYLNKRCRLVFMPDSVKRIANPNYNVNNSSVSFADGFQYLLISEASLDDLNSRLEQPLPMNRFRPNIVVSGTEPFAEDSWEKIQIGEVTFFVVKPCPRCVITTIDQETGLKGKEPLQTLNTYRNIDGQVLFGQNMIPGNIGILKTGDEVQILE